MEGSYYKTKDTAAEYIRLAGDANGQELINELQVHFPSCSSVLKIVTGTRSDWEILSELNKVVCLGLFWSVYKVLKVDLT